MLTLLLRQYDKGIHVLVRSFASCQPIDHRSWLVLEVNEDDLSIMCVNRREVWV